MSAITTSPTRSESGFTLIEVLVTLVIVAVAVLSLGSFTISTVKSGQTSHARLAAVHLAEQVLEFWQHDANDFAPVIATADCTLSAANAQPQYPVTVTCTPASGGSAAFTVVTDQAPATGPLPGNLNAFQNFTKQGYANTPQTKVVTVSWSSQGKTRSVFLTHMSAVK
jgi:prepilin-type N-terminal cleavage/methylation domain-containing protein